MAALSPNAFLTKYNDALNGLFRNGQTSGIGSNDMRDFVQDIKDSLSFLSSLEANDFNVPVTQLFFVNPGSGTAESSWDWDNQYLNIGILVANYDDIEISFENQPLGGSATLFIKKTISGDVTLTVPSSESVGNTSPTTSIVLSGATNTIFKIDFYITETSGFQVVSSVDGAFTKLLHTSASNVLSLLGNLLYRSTDNGITWALWYTSPDTTIVDFDLNGSNGCLITSTPTSGSNGNLKVYSTTDGGDNWTLEATLSNNEIDLFRTISYYGADDFYIGTKYSNIFYRWDGAVLGSFSLGPDSTSVAVENCVLSSDLWILLKRPDIIYSWIAKRTGATTFTTYIVSPLTISSLYSIDFATSSLGVCVGTNSSGDPTIVKSVDGGATWSVKTIDVNIGTLRKVRAITATAFICIGDNGIGHSTDSGENWTYYSSPVDGTALSAWDGDDILVATDALVVWKGFGTSVGNIFSKHGESGISGLTTGRVPFASSPTSITDDPSLSWDNSTKTLTLSRPDNTRTLNFTANASNNIYRAKVAAGSNLLSIKSADGISGDVNGELFTLSGGNGLASGNSDGGELRLQGGVANGSGTHGNVVANLSQVSQRLVVYKNANDASGMKYPLQIWAVASSASVGIGVGIEFKVFTGSGNHEVGSTIESVATDITATSEDFDLSFKTMSAGATASEKLRVTSDGRLYGAALHNNAGPVTGTTNQYIASGTYTPSLNIIANISAATPHKFMWARVGNVVSGSGMIEVDAANPGTANLRISIPIASTFAAEEDAAGTIGLTNISFSGIIKANVANGDLELVFEPVSGGSLSSQEVRVMYQYEIL